MFQTNTINRIFYTLRIACAMCFIGHGAFGIITKEVWCNYFGVFGIDKATSFTLMPYVGTVDIILGLLILFYPVRLAFGWLVIWGTLTALCRPLSGEPFAEFIERAGNYGAPLALLLLTYNSNNKWMQPLNIKQILFDEKTMKRVTICLRVVVFLLFLGHGWLNLLEKKSLLSQYQSLGFTNTIMTAHIVGTLEILAAISVLIKPFHAILIVFFVWKMTTELFYPHWEIFEFIERGGSYGSILALWFITRPSLKILFRKQQSNAAAL